MESEGESDFSARLSTHPEVLAVSPTMEDFVLLTHRDRQLAIALTAVDPILDSAVVDMEPAGVLGDWQDFIDQEYGIAIGMQAANALGLDIGDTVRVNFARVRVLPTGLYPISRGFVVTSIFATNSQIDLELAMVRLEDAEPLMRNSSAESGWRIKLENPLLAESAFREYSQDNQYRLVPWQSRLHGLYEAMKMEKIVVGAMLVLVVLVASFSLVASLVMTVAEKRTDIAVLKTMGADSSIIVGIFVFQALVLGFVGIACGALLGTVLALNFSELIRFFESLFGFQVFDPNVFYVSQLPTDWRFSDLLVVCGVSGCIALLTSIVPAIQAARIAPAEAIHSNG
jgi:lipoprotein-releasing system permease protein